MPPQAARKRRGRPEAPLFRGSEMPPQATRRGDSIRKKMRLYVKVISYEGVNRASLQTRQVDQFLYSNPQLPYHPVDVTTVSNVPPTVGRQVADTLQSRQSLFRVSA